MKRVTSFLLILAMLVSMIPTQTWATEVNTNGECGVEGDNVAWNFDEKTNELSISGEGTMSDFPHAEDNDVNASPWAEYADVIFSVVIEEGVTAIGEAAFYNCNVLKKVELPVSIDKIGKEAFSGCEVLVSVDYAGSVGQWTSVEVGENNDTLFGIEVNCTSTDCYHENGIESCSVCQEETAYTEANEQIKEAINADDALSDAEQEQVSNADELTALQVEAFEQTQFGDIIASGECGAEGDSVFWTLDTDGGMTITGSGRILGFPEEYKQQILTVVIEEGITAVGDSAFSGCSNLRSITIPDGVNEIQNAAFQNCSSLASIEIPYGVSTINQTTFTHCINLTSISIPSSVTHIGANAFFNCTSLSSITIPNSVTKLGDSAFAGCTSLISITIPENVKEIEYGLFRGCTNLSAIHVDGGNSDYSSIEGILYDAAGTTLILCPEGKSGSVSVPAGVTTIDNSAFISCTKVTSITLPNSITKIYPLAFGYCSGLTEITVNAGGSVLGDMIFSGCDALNTLNFTNDAPSFSSNTFSGLIATAYYPANNSTWTEEVMQNYGGTITWVPAGGDSSGTGNADYIRLLPANGATDVGYTLTDPPVVEIEFSKEIVGEVLSQYTLAELDFTAGTLRIHKQSDDAVVYEIEQDNGVNWLHKIDGTFSFEAKVVDGNTLKIDFTNPHTVLEPSTEYYITVDGGFVKFADDTTCQAIEKGEWEFTTAAETFETCSLEELKSIDYLAFSYIVYQDAQEGETVREILDSCWDENWGDTSIKHSELFDHIENWSLYRVCDEPITGFGAYVFKNEQNEAVISYRGSASIAINYDAFADWTGDIYMYMGGKGAQIDIALNFTAPIIKAFGADNVATTGHSLGGGISDIISAQYSCKAESFNAAPFLVIAYKYCPEDMGMSFSGTNNWKFIDHVTDGDNMIGEVGTEMKNYKIHERNPGYTLNAHSLESMVTQNDIGEIDLTDVVRQQKITSIVKSRVNLSILESIVLGTNREDVIIGVDTAVRSLLYGGDDCDSLSGNIGGDVLVGGSFGDILDGSWGSDTYYYFKGDGEDWIFDLTGTDTIELLNFESTDAITAEVDGAFTNILCNGETIIHISRDRESWGFNQNKFFVKVNSSKLTDITAYLSPRKTSGRVTIACPVNVEIVDDNTGTVVYTLYDAANSVGSYHTDYGYFYVYEDENGELVKVADLFEGYSVRIVGAGTGTMDISVYEPTNDGLSDALQAKDVPVTTNLIATVEDIDGEKYLVIDTDGDGREDNRVQLTERGTEHIHSGGTATCTQKAICSGCGETYGDYATHDYESAWSQGDANGHWHKCKNCNAHDTQVAHTPGAAVTATTAQACTVCGYVIKAATGSPTTETTQPEGDDEPTKYKITSGKNKKWRKGSDYGLSITVDAPQDDFIRVLVEGKELSSSNYWISGDMIITLKVSYLEDLPRDKYTIRIEFDDGYAETTFTVASAIMEGMPFTGDNFNLTFWLGVNIISGLSLLAIFAVFLRKRYLSRQTRE